MSRNVKYVQCAMKRNIAGGSVRTTSHIPQRSTPRYANRQSDSAAGSTDLGRVFAGSIPALGTDNNKHGALVQREDVCFASRKSGFDSPVLHLVYSNGSVGNRKTTLA